MKEITYESVCEKLGFCLEDYAEVSRTFPDDYNCFRKLSIPEQDYVLEFFKQRGIDGR